MSQNGPWRLHEDLRSCPPRGILGEPVIPGLVQRGRDRVGRLPDLLVRDVAALGHRLGVADGDDKPY